MLVHSLDKFFEVGISIKSINIVSYHIMTENVPTLRKDQPLYE